MGSRIVCCFVLYSAFDSKIMQLANRRLTFQNRPPLSSRIRLDANAIIDG